jgi:uncharacterized protein (DUF1684 family)
MRYARATWAIGFSLLAGAADVRITAQKTATPSARTQTAYDAQATEQWRAKREATLKGPDGWLSVAGLFFLKPGVNTLGSDPQSDIALPAGAAPEHTGRIRFENGKALLNLEPGVQATINDKPVSGAGAGAGSVELRGPSDEEHRSADLLHIGRLTLLLHHSGERAAIRLRDPESAIRREFTGLKWFPVDAAWNVTGTFEKFKEPRKLKIPNVLGDIDEETSSGEVTVTIAGKTLKLLPIDEDGRLWFIFSDGLAGTDTYRIRFLYADAPQNGRVTLDFNRAYNPPCAYNPFTTCPLPPPQNRLRVPVRAGERAYGPHPIPTSGITASPNRSTNSTRHD